MDDKMLDAYLRKVDEILAMTTDPGDLEEKARYIRTPEGAARYGGKIGDLITEDMKPTTNASTAIRRSAASNTPRTVNTRMIASAAQRRRATEQRDRTRAEGQNRIREAAKKRREAAPSTPDHWNDTERLRATEAMPRGTQKEKSAYTLQRATNDARSGDFVVRRGVDGWPRIQREFGNGMTFNLVLHDDGATYDTYVTDASGTTVAKGVFRGDAASIRQYGLDDLFDRVAKNAGGTTSRRRTGASKPSGGSGSHKLSRSMVGEFSYMHDTSYNHTKYNVDGDTVTWDSEEGRLALMDDLDNWIDILDDHVQNETGAEKQRQRRLKQAFQAFYDSLKMDGGQKWDDLAPEFKDDMGALVDAGTHEWVEDPNYDGVEALVEVGSMKALAVIYRDGTVDLDYEFKSKPRYVRNPEWWGVPYGTRIVPGMKPVGRGPKD